MFLQRNPRRAAPWMPTASRKSWNSRRQRMEICEILMQGVSMAETRRLAIRQEIMAPYHLRHLRASQ
jgi:hypothetical protein